MEKYNEDVFAYLIYSIAVFIAVFWPLGDIYFRGVKYDKKAINLFSIIAGLSGSQLLLAIYFSISLNIYETFNPADLWLSQFFSLVLIILIAAVYYKTGVLSKVGADRTEKKKKKAQDRWLRKNKPILILLPTDNTDVIEIFNDFLPNLNVPETLSPSVVSAFSKWYENQPVYTRHSIEDKARKIISDSGDYPAMDKLLDEALKKSKEPPVNLKEIAWQASEVARYLPKWDLIKEPDGTGRPWRDYLVDPNLIQQSGVNTYYQTPPQSLFNRLPDELRDGILSITIATEIPEKLRNEHHHIIATTGHGKTQLLQSMILDDLKRGVGIIVIDSQGQLIENIYKLKGLPRERIILIDPTDIEYPPAVSLFSFPDTRSSDPLQRELAQNSAAQMFEYIFSALDAEMTSKQDVVLRYVCRLMMEVPDANIHSLRRVLEPNGLDEFRPHIDKLGDVARAFFINEFDGRSFRETKEQVLRRIYTLLESNTFATMFSATESRFDIRQAIWDKKIILINTAIDLLQETGSSIFGRYWIAQIAQAISLKSEANKPRTYLYIDEFQEYAGETYINTILEQARKNNLGLIVAHHNLEQLPQRVGSLLSSNTSIKFAGAVSYEDQRVMAKRLQCEPERLGEVPRFTFVTNYRGIGTTTYTVTPGRMEAEPQRTPEEVENLKQFMRNRYSSPVVQKDIEEKPPVPDDGW